MGKLHQAFEKPETKKDFSFLGSLFSSPIIRGFYKDEKPAVDVTLNGGKYEQLRMTALINTIANNSPTGRKILEAAAEAGYTFGFQCQSGSYGFCDSDKKRICLSPTQSDEKLITTLAHEARHAQQHTNGVPEFHTFDLASELKLRRATEADAQAAAVQTALEIRASTKDEKVWDTFRKSDAHIADSVREPAIDEPLKSVTEKSDVNMRNAFKGWFRNRQIVDGYEEVYFYNPLYRAKYTANQNLPALFAESPFEGHKTSADILRLVCTNGKDGGYFANDLDIMDRNREMCGISSNTRAAANLFFHKRKSLTGKAPDTSYENLPTRGDMTRRIGTELSPMPKEIKAPTDKKALPPSLIAGLNKLRRGR